MQRCRATLSCYFTRRAPTSCTEHHAHFSTRTQPGSYSAALKATTSSVQLCVACAGAEAGIVGVRYSASPNGPDAETSGVQVCGEKRRERFSARTCCILDEIAAAGSVSDGVSAPLGRVLHVWESLCEALLSVCLSCRLSERRNPTVIKAPRDVEDTELCNRSRPSYIYWSINRSTCGHFWWLTQ